MKPNVNRTAAGPFEMMDLIAETIRSLSARARTMTITADSLLLEDLALDSLDLAYPEVDQSKLKELAAAKKKLLS